MSLTRQTQKVFCSNGNANEIAAFGSMKTGTPVYSTSLSTLQSQEYTEGWAEAIESDKAPYLEEMNGVQYGFSYQIAYILQEGIPEYDANTEYTNKSVVKTVNNGILTIYVSKVNNNTGNALSNTTYWKPMELDLSGKADIDLANTTPAQTFKNNTIDWGMPDYANKVSVGKSSVEDGYAAINDGYFMALVYPYFGAEVFINNVSLGAIWYQTYGGMFLMTVPLSKNDEIKIKRSSGTTWAGTSEQGFAAAYFIPCKGV